LWTAEKHYATVAFVKLLISIPILAAIVSLIIRPKLEASWLSRKKRLQEHTKIIDAFPKSQIGVWIALAAGLGLFIELMIIRLHSSYFQLFAYFKNVSLLSSFLGLGIGYAVSRKRSLTTPLVLPLLALQIVFLDAVKLSKLSQILQNPISEQFTLGLQQSSTFETIIVYLFLSIIFTFNALCFVPLGQLAARLMRRKKKLQAYSWNLIGSLAGILLFSLISFLWTPPIIWIAIAALGTLVFLYKDMKSMVISLVSVGIIFVFISVPARLDQLEIHSPYQILTLKLSNRGSPVLLASNTYYQRMVDLSEESVKLNNSLILWDDYYGLPYRFKPEPENVLVVGSGTGNDVASGLRNGAKSIDAVEIDPAILKVGKTYHPESPYGNDRVNAIVDDARVYIRYTDKKYDLIVYGLLDSHTLLSGRSGGVRLDSYVYTVEAFKEARKRLKDKGIISVTFNRISKGIGFKIYEMLEEAFEGEAPIVYNTFYDGGITYLAGEGIDQIRPDVLSFAQEVTLLYETQNVEVDKSTDDWPFLYMPVRRYPFSYVMMIVLLVVLSIIFIRRMLPDARKGFSAPCFFLGAGFMLIETKGITELALFYGSTWFVTSAVIVGILIMGFLANLLVMKRGTFKPEKTYGLLVASLVLGILVTYVDFASGFPVFVKIVRTGIITLPLFFSGFAFSSELKRTESAGVALSSNLLGAMLGGFLEYNSMFFGFRSLYYLAIIVYGFAYLSSNIRVERRFDFLRLIGR
jgi:hypothetical protein